MLLFALGGTATKIILFILSLSILVVLHELGHFIPAKLFGTRVHKFYLFFDFLFPFPDKLNFSLFKKKIGDTEYGIGWFPFGGYVQIAGMADETQDAEALKNSEPQPWEFRSKKPWQRLIIMIGGVTVNMLLAMVIFSGLLWKYGEEKLPMKNVTNGIAIEDSLAYDLGLQNGDKLIAINGKEIETFEYFQKDMILNSAKTVTIERAGNKIDLVVKDDFLNKLIKLKKQMIISPRIITIVGDVASGSNAEKAGLKKGDKFISVDSVATPFFDQLKEQLKIHAGEKVVLNIDRNGKPVTLNAEVTKEGKLGFAADADYTKYFKTVKTDYNFVAAIPAGTTKAFETLGNYFKSIKMLFEPKGPKLKDSVGGFASMAKMFPDTFDWQSFWILTATISVILAFMNILPIPMLDGGYVLFLIYEMIVGKPLPDKVQNVAQSIGMIFILGLLLFANGMDFIRGFFH
ncbi:MAG: RIP metalloprotease RseP [Chitinophagales bacterium]